MRRLLFTMLATVSLLLCLPAVYLCVLSHSTTGFEYAREDPPRIAVEAIDGRIFLLQWEFAQFPMLHIMLPPGTSDHRAFVQTRWLGTPPPFWERMGFGYLYKLFQGREYRAISFPSWLPILLTALAPAAWLLCAYLRRRRRKRGLCLHCGYDLRASRNRCPECGAPIPTP